MANEFANWQGDVEAFLTRLENFVASDICDVEGFQEGMELQTSEAKQRFTAVCTMWLTKLSVLKSTGVFELCNEYSVKTGARILQLLKPSYDDLSSCFAKLDTKWLTSLTEVVIPAMAEIPTAPQQRFSSMVFRWISCLDDLAYSPVVRDRVNEAKSHLDDEFYCTPVACV